jgi:hypothetical protein
MALYAIGDIQGCDEELGALLEVPEILRGPRSALVRRRSRESRTRIARHTAPHSRAGRRRNRHARQPRPAPAGGFLRVGAHPHDDTLADILAAPDRDALLEWLIPKKGQIKSLIPWFEAPGARWQSRRVVFGHWSTLGYFSNSSVIALDTGCVWGGSLTALRLDVVDAKPVQVPCRASRTP